VLVVDEYRNERALARRETLGRSWNVSLSLIPSIVVALGETVNVAVRLGSLAAAGELLLSDAAAQPAGQ